jgi:hypothetical protein
MLHSYKPLALDFLFCGRMECSLELSAYIATPFHELQFNYKRLEKAPLFFHISAL